MNKYYVTLDELFGIQHFNDLTTEIIMNKLVEWDCINEADIFTRSVIEDNIEILKNYVFPRHFHSFVSKSLDYEDENYTNYNLQTWGNLFIRLMRYSSAKYKNVAQLYINNANNLLNKVATITHHEEQGHNENSGSGNSTSENLHSDTPTTKEIAQVVDLKYLSDYLKNINVSSTTDIGDNTISGNNTSESDFAPIINRLDDISKSWEDINQKWANEFNTLFIVEGALL